MTYSGAIDKGSDIIKKNYWLLLIPIVYDAVFLLLNYLSVGVFIDISRIPQFQLKFAVPSALPSLKNLVDAFPDLISWNTSSGFQPSLLSSATIMPHPWNSVYKICSVLFLAIFSAFIKGGFLGCMAKTYDKGVKASFRDFVFYGQYYWSRFLSLDILGYIAILMALVFIPIIFVYFFIGLLIFYLSYALVWDDVSVLEAITKAVSRFTSRFGNSLGFIIYIAFILGIASLIIIPLSRFNVFLGSIFYNVCACYLVAGILAMYAGEKPDPEISTESNDGGFNVKV